MNAPSRLFGLLGATTLALGFGLGSASCGNRNDDINRVDPGYVKKSVFTTGDEWYYRRTIVQSETTNEIAIEGQGDIWMDRVKFRIEENFLIAYRPYEAVPGSQGQEEPGSQDFEGSVLAAWPITSHFDIKRGYDDTTGNETNVVSENSSDRHWNEREYMRVDFGTNTIERSFSASTGVFDFPLDVVSTGSRWAHCDSEPTNEHCSRFTSDSVDVVEQVFLGMDINTCAAFVGYAYDGYSNCGYGEAKVRHNFTRIPTPSDYMPRDYPDSYVRKDADGKALRDPDTGEVLREAIYDRFGVFRLEIPTYDRGQGTTESGRLFRAMIFNLWERHTDDAGKLLLPAQRTPKAVIYYLNAEYPSRWRQAAREVAAEYDRVLTGLVKDVSGKTPGFPMFELRDNDCNEGKIKNFVSTNPDLVYAVKRVVCKDGGACEKPLDLVGIGNLNKICTSLENASRDPATGTPAFDWQRPGDSRFKMVVWLPNPQQSGWGGYGPMHSDGRTGEGVSATAFLRGYSYEEAAATIADYVDFINDDSPDAIEKVVYGQNIRREAARTRQKVLEMSATTASPLAVAKIAQRISNLGSSKEELLPELDPNSQRHRMKRIEGTKLESDYLVDELRLQLASNGKWKPGTAISDDLRRRATPAGWMEQENPLSDVADRTRRALTQAGFCFLKADFDPHWAGLALELKDMKDRQARYEFAGNMMIKHVMLHELGHNFGLAHNFEGSYDALNYSDTFWDNHWADDATKVRNRYDEKRNTTVMEYMSAKGAFTDSLGKYDEAAIRFAYANQVEVFDKTDVTGGLAFKNWREYRGDYNAVPDYVCAGSAEALKGGARCATPEEARQTIRNRKWVEFNAQNPPKNEVPYLFCDNYYDRRTPFCATFDYGSSQVEIFANYYRTWKDYFYFNNFIRDRLVPLNWSPNQAMGSVIYAMLHWATVGQYLYFLRINDEDFRNSQFEADLVATVGHGLNFAAEVVATPETGRMCPFQGTNPKVYLPWYFQQSTCDGYAAINSPYALQAEAIHVPLGPGRPISLGFTDDFVDYDISFVGSYFDKYNMMWLLGLVRQNLFMRFDFEGAGGSARHQRYNYSLFRILEPEIRGFYDKLMKLDSYMIDFDTATDLGSWWCRDPGNPTAAHMGYFEPRKMIDPATLEPAGAPAGCTNPALIWPRLVANAPFDAMYFAHSLFSSEFDTALDMGKSLKIYVVGSDDEFPAWRDLPPTEMCSCVDQLTGLDYRAIHQPTGIPDIGCRLLERACDAQNDYLGERTSDWRHDRWRSWFERLEFARDLTRVYDR